jgi:uncharacterized membrane protein (DUF373 family)
VVLRTPLLGVSAFVVIITALGVIRYLIKLSKERTLC